MAPLVAPLAFLAGPAVALAAGALAWALARAAAPRPAANDNAPIVRAATAAGDAPTINDVAG